MVIDSSWYLTKTMFLCKTSLTFTPQLFFNAVFIATFYFHLQYREPILPSRKYIKRPIAIFLFVSYSNCTQEYYISTYVHNYGTLC